jgi:hypothetical protein
MSLASQLPVAPPWVLDPASQWITVGEFAVLWNKHRHTIRNWCESGFFSTLGISTYRDPRGHWYIRVS